MSKLMTALSHARRLLQLPRHSPPSPAPLSRALHASAPRAGIKDTLSGIYASARGGADEKRETAMFDVQMGLLRDRSRTFDGNRFLDLLAAMKDAAGMGGVKEHLPWVANNPALGEIKDQQAIVHAMTPAERARVAGMGIAAKKRVARSTGQSLDAIDAVTQQVVTLERIQKWLAAREDSGGVMPVTSGELRDMVGAPGSGMSKKPPKASKAGRMRPGVKGGR